MKRPSGSLSIDSLSRSSLSRGSLAHRTVLLGCLLGIALAGCTYIGPKSISSGRLAYNEAIAETNNQQMLMVLVHNRYDEQGSMLAVASVTANVSVKSSAGVQAGFGGSSSYQGNLIPFAGGVIYEENPTISYTPVAGEKYLSRLSVPLPIGMLAQITRTQTDPRAALIGLISSVNGIYNPDFVFGENDHDPRFDRIVTIISELSQAHRLNWVEIAGKPEKFSIVIDRSAPEHAAMAQELLDIIGLSREEFTGPQIVIPVVLSLNGAREGVMGITTRSIYDLVEIMTARIEVPPIDEENGVVAEYPPVGRLGKDLTVHYSEKEPEHAYVAVADRGGWFYIDERDRITKRYFRLLSSLWSLAVASSVADGPAAPLLTVPVSN
ncbi:MAG: hypothetical protein KDI14_17625 [Halioglobus sp.]|nr:hypothetical protein [Halioglobus sp.]